MVVETAGSHEGVTSSVGAMEKSNLKDWLPGSSLTRERLVEWVDLPDLEWWREVVVGAAYSTKPFEWM